jgi:hypothetical protein
MIQDNLCREPHPLVPDETVVETLRTAITRAARLPRSADRLLCSLGAEYLLEELHGAGLASVHPVAPSSGR